MKKLMIIFLPILIIAGGFFLLKSRSGSDKTDGIQNSKQTERKVLLTGDEKIKGNPNASLTIVEYADFQCPGCAMVQGFWKKIWRILDADVRLVFRHFPIETIHANSREASLFSELANLQGKFWEMHDIIFDRQKEWSPLSSPTKVFESYAEEIGLDLIQMQKDLKEKRKLLEGKIDQDISSGNSLGIRSVPSILIDNKLIDFPEDASELLKTVKHHLTNR